MPVSSIGVLFFNPAFTAVYDLSSLYLFKPFFIITFNKLSLILDYHACDYDTRATKTELINIMFRTIVI